MTNDESLALPEFDLDNLRLEDLEVSEHAGKSGELAQTAKDMRGGNFLPEWKFRLCKPHDNPYLQWNVPDSDIAEEVPLQVLAIRGIPIRYGNGFSLFLNKDKRTVCQTVAIEPDGKAPFPLDLGPMPQFVYGPQKFEEPRTPDGTIYSLNPVGSRGFSCISCVQNGLHMITYKDKDGVDQTARCSGRGTIIFYVTHLCIAKTNAAQRKTTEDWRKVTEIKDADGHAIFERPFLLNVSVSQGTATKGLGKTIMPKPPVPSDVLSWSYFLAELSKHGVLTDHVKGQPVGHMLIPALVEMWAAKPIEAQKDKMASNMVKAIPGFRVFTTEIDGTPQSLVGTKVMDSYIHTAYEALKAEYVTAGGRLDEEGLLQNPRRYTPLNPESQQLALESASKAGTKDEEQELRSAVPSEASEATINVSTNPYAADDDEEDDTEDVEISSPTVVAPPPVFQRSRNGGKAQ
jgi:hypothetical protein